MNRNINEGQRPKATFSSRRFAALSAAAALTAAACVPVGNQETCTVSGPPEWSSGHKVEVWIPASLTQTEAMKGTNPLPEDVWRRPSSSKPHTMLVYVGDRDPQMEKELGIAKGVPPGFVEIDVKKGPQDKPICTVEVITVRGKKMRERPTATPTPTTTKDTATQTPAP